MMDLGISGKTALICGASEGLGYAIAAALAQSGVHIVLAARREGPLAAAQQTLTLAYPTVTITAIAGDVTGAEGQRALLAAAAAPDILITNAGGPPVGDFMDFEGDAWQAALNANMLAPLALIRAVLPGMRARRFGRILNITSAMLKISGHQLPLSNGARLGLIGAVSAPARQAVVDNVTINNLLPGLFETSRGRAVIEGAAKKTGRDYATVLTERTGQIPAGRLGQASEFGAYAAFLCSAHAGYITGQSLVIDGGTFPGVF